MDMRRRRRKSYIDDSGEAGRWDGRGGKGGKGGRKCSGAGSSRPTLPSEVPLRELGNQDMDGDCAWTDWKNSPNVTMDIDNSLGTLVSARRSPPLSLIRLNIGSKTNTPPYQPSKE